MILPGDVLFFHRPFSLGALRADPWGVFCTTLIHLSTRSRWNHAAICTIPGHYAEATGEGVRVSPWSSSRDVVSVVRPTYDDEDDRLTAVAWASARVGLRYGYLNAVMCGVNNVLVGLGWVVKRTDAIICSELVAEALERAGYDFGKDPSTVSPGDLAEALGLDR